MNISPGVRNTPPAGIPVFWNPAMYTDEAQGYSPSAGKPKLVVEDWREHFPEAIDIIASTPASRSDIKTGHDPAYVDGVLDCEIENGFGTHSKALAATLPYTTGSLLSAARYVVDACDRKNELSHIPVACSPTSGFHHAGYASGGGFCTFNGLVITAMRLKAMGLVDYVGILDCDQHYGDGTQDIIDRLGLNWIIHRTAGEHYRREHEAVSSISVKRWFSKLFGTAWGDQRGKGGILLYQAGADAHIDDPLGGYLTTGQMAERDSEVFRTCKMYGIPVAWNLAGGYQRDGAGFIEPVLALHRQTMRICINEWKGGR